MQSISREVEDAIKGAIKLEIDGKNFFIHAAEVTASELGKKMFQFLAAEEVKHLETFGRLFSSILKGEDWKKYAEGRELSSEAPLIKKLKENMKRNESKGEIEALRVGMELEKEAIEFFRKASDAAADPAAAKIFHEISEEEKFHYDLLQAQYDSVTKSGIWLGSAEFRMDGKW